MEKVTQVMGSRSTTDSTLKPKLEIPVFDGDVMGYIDWYEVVEATILKSNMTKENQYLTVKSYLKGEAAERVKRVRISNKAVDEVIAILNWEYNSPTVVVRRIMEKLKDHPIV
jgi:hypothetical protein